MRNRNGAARRSHQGFSGRYGKNGQVFTSPADAPRTREADPEHHEKGLQGEYACECGATVRLIKSTFSDREAGIKYGQPIVPNHRPGGGKVSVLAGDRVCSKSLKVAFYVKDGEVL